MTRLDAAGRRYDDRRTRVCEQRLVGWLNDQLRDGDQARWVLWSVLLSLYMRQCAAAGVGPEEAHVLVMGEARDAAGALADYLRDLESQPFP